MSCSKWRALQHRHRYTYSSVDFPPYFTEALNQTPSQPFFTELKHLVSLGSIYTQIEHAKHVASAFINLISNPNTDPDTCSLAAKLYLEISFMENSLPLHKTLTGYGLSRVKNCQGLIKDCLRQLFEEYGNDINGNENGKGRRFCVSRAALTLMGTPKLGYLVEVVEECAVLVGTDVVSGLNAVITETNDWSRPSPIVMEQCQEALSCMYYLLQRFPHKYSNVCGERAVELLGVVFVAVFNILKSQAFPRDCLVAAGVTFFAALLVLLGAEELGLFIMGGIFSQASIVDCKISLKDVIGKIPYHGDLDFEISSFTPLSRLCLIRGILTAVSRTVLNSAFFVSRSSFEGDGLSGDDHGLIRTILYDGILPELCNYSENPIDSHFNFHSLTVLQICLQQIKTSLQSNTGDITGSYDPISEQMGHRILRIVWNNLEDPLSQTVKQVHLVLDLFLDIQATLHGVEGGEKNKLFLREIAHDLLRLGSRCKGRYVPLATLTKRLGAKTMLDMSPKLIFEAMSAYIDDDVCCAATTFLRCFLEHLRDENWSSCGVDAGYTKYRDDCLPPFLCGLASGVTKLRSNLNTYALPILLELDVDSLFPMLASIGVGLFDKDTELVFPQLHLSDLSLRLEQRVAVLISLLKVSRLIALIEGDIDWYKNISKPSEAAMLNTGQSDVYCSVTAKGIIIKIAVDWLVLALTHGDDLLRIDAAEFFFLNPKTASLPSSLELSLMKRAVPLNMRSCSTAFQMKWTSLFRKFFGRVRTALERQYKQGTWFPGMLMSKNGIEVKEGSRESVAGMAQDLFNLMKWLSCFLFSCCYPSAPYERKIMAMELFLVMLSVWSVTPQSEGDANTLSSLYPYSKGLTSSDSSLLLVGSVIDSWDRLRENSFRILLHFPTPIPCFVSPHEVQQAIIWAKKLVCSPRVRESDAGALSLRLMFRKYVVELRWIVNANLNYVACHTQSDFPNGHSHDHLRQSPVVEYIGSLVDWLLVAVEDGEKNLSEACKKSFVHGVLLTLRYTFEELDWNSNDVLSSIAQMKVMLEKLLELVMRITSLALWVVSSDAWHLPEDMEEMEDDDAFPIEIPHDEISTASSVENDKENAKLMQDMRLSAQTVMVGCWLAMKEVSLLLGTIIRKIPLPSADASTSGSPDISNGNVLVSDGVFDLNQLETIGNHFLEVLLKMKHNGAIDKTRAGFTALCNRLLCSNDPRLCKLTESWMDKLMERTVARGQTVDDLLRRSAGIPAAFIALFLSEPEGSPKRLLPRALRWLLDVASGVLLKQTTVGNDVTGDVLSTNSSQVNEEVKISKIRDEGVIPTVHAFNVLKAAFNDANLATDTSGFAAEALIVSVCSFSSPYWEVRNSACLAYTALVRRMIGFLNVRKRESAKRSLTGLEFFHRYPSLHSFLIHELQVATESLLDGSSGDSGSNLVNVVHPSLCPILIFLARLKPSAIASESGDTLDPFLFMPLIRKCSVQSNFRIRVLASKALTGLVSNEKLPVVLLNIASQLPSANAIFSLPSNSSSPEYGASHTSNSVHGMLLQLNSLLDNNCRNLVDSSKRDKILIDLIHILSLSSWIGKTRLCPSPILTSCFLNVLDSMLSIARTCTASASVGAIWKLTWELCSDFFESEDSQRTSYYDPTRVELHKQVTMSYLNCICQTSKEVAEEDLLMPWTRPSPATNLMRMPDLDNALAFQERLMRSICNLSYEVRLATLKWLFLVLKTSGAKTQGSNLPFSEIKTYCLKNMDLQRTLMDLLEGEKNHKCSYYILKILYHWNFLEYEEEAQQQESLRLVDGDCNSLQCFWDKLVSIYTETRHPKNQQMLLRCMGVCVKQFGNFFSRFLPRSREMEGSRELGQSDEVKLASFYSRISYFIDLVQMHSDASETVTMRKAAAESIVASGLLDQASTVGPLVSSSRIPDADPCSEFKIEEAVNLYAHKILIVWYTCIELLEDEDDGLRTDLALDVQKCFVSRESHGMVPSQVDKVIEMSFEHISSAFGHWIDYLDILCRWTLDAANSVAVIVSKGDLVRRVFDKEIDNYHEEKLMVCMIGCSHLENLPVNFCSNLKLRDFLHEWRRRFHDTLVSFTDSYAGQQEGVDWIGGNGNHKDAFLPVYGNLLAFYSLSNRIFHGEAVEDSEVMLNELLQLGEALRPFLRNPMICNLYLCVIGSHTKMAGASPSDFTQYFEGDSYAWEDFNPYFLLK